MQHVAHRASDEIAQLRQENARLKAAGDRLLGLLSRVSDQATEEQAAEHERMVDSLRRIWVEAKHPNAFR